MGDMSKQDWVAERKKEQQEAVRQQAEKNKAKSKS